MLVNLLTCDFTAFRGVPNGPGSLQAEIVTEHETDSGSPSAAAGGSTRAVLARAVPSCCCWCASAAGAGYALHGPAAAVALAAAGAAACAVVIVLLSVLIGCKDQRSPFERLMLIACLLAGRLPADHLPPPGASERQPVARAKAKGSTGRKS
jgi:hypothetical protein